MSPPVVCRAAVSCPVALWFTRVLAIIGIAGIAGVAHSYFVPVSLTRKAEARTPAPQNTSSPTGQPSDPTTSPVTPPPTDQQTDPAPNQAQDQLPDGYIGLDEAHALFERSQTGEPIWFLDARHDHEFEAGHIPGAFLMPASRVQTSEGLEDLGFIDPTGTVVIYCVGGDCDASENTAIMLENLGYTDIVIMKAGFDDWAASGFPVEP